jgi:hypothetical protein
MFASHRLPYFALVLALLIGVWLRLDGLYAMQNQLQSDEAYYAMNAISLIEQPRIQFFFPENTGREGLWMHILAPAIVLWGAIPFTLRYVAAMVAILTLAAVARLGREVLGKWGAVWAVLALSGLYVHLHNSHVAFRVLLFPLVGALALAWLLRARRRNQSSDWIIAAIFTGLLAHTYTAAHGWLACLWAVAILWAIFDKTRRRGAIIVCILAPLIAAPVYLAMAANPAPDGGIERTLVTDALLFNVQNWLEAWRQDGDLNHNHNIPALPILDDPQTLLILAGIIGSWLVVRRRWQILLVVILFILALIPSVLTLRTPQYIRAFGMVVPVALCIAAGAAGVQKVGNSVIRRVRRKTPPLATALPDNELEKHSALRTQHSARTRLALVVPALLLLWSCVHASQLFHRWLNEYRLSLFIDERVNAAMMFIRQNTAPNLPIYIPYGGLTGESTLPYHPVAAFHAYQMRRDLVFFPFPEGENTCFIAPRNPALFVDFPNIINRLGERMQPYGTVEALYQQPDNEYNVWQFTPDPEINGEWNMSAVMGGMLQVRALPPYPANVQPGDTITVRLALRVLRPVDYPYRVFLHLQGTPTPYEGGRLFSTGDAPLCAAALQPTRTPQETVIQSFNVPVPADLPPGNYHIAVGMYNPETNNRLALAAPGGETRFYRAVEFTLN